MSEAYLYGAEADQIQETLFRASRLRQVVGGSRLIDQFGRQATLLANNHGAIKVLIAAGGSFRAIFPSAETAKAFGTDLADCYRAVLEASLTLAGEEVLQPDCVLRADNFRERNRQVHQSIRRRKQSERGRHASAQTPTTALCQYSGTGLAGMLVKRPGENRHDYVAAAVDRMHRAGERVHDDDPESFLGRIAACLPKVEGLPQKWPDEVENILRLDPERSNVAYLLADGNGLGKLFGECDSREQLWELSIALDNAMREAVTEPIPDLFNRLNQARLKAEKKALTFLPVLPLILAGDDAFVLLPAYYALDYARRFCKAFEDAMRRLLTASPRLEPLLSLAPTIGAAVILCKGHFPYRIAHERGEARLNQAKQLSKSFVQATGDKERLSAISFEMIAGNELIEQKDEVERRFRAELRPYWVDDELSEDASSYGMSLITLLKQRLDLQGTPGKRLAELRALYASEALPEEKETDAAIKHLQETWEPRLLRLKQRMDATEAKSGGNLLWSLRALGAKQGIGFDYWREVRRGEGGNPFSFYASGLPDLIEVWDYAQSLDREMVDYKNEDRSDRR